VFISEPFFMSQIEFETSNPEAQDLYQRLLQKGIELLAMREHCEHEIVQKLTAKAKPKKYPAKRYRSGALNHSASSRGRRRQGRGHYGSEYGSEYGSGQGLDGYSTGSASITDGGLDNSGLTHGELPDRAEPAAYSVESVVGRVVQELKDLKYLSDERYVESFVRSRINRGYGPIKIRYELSQKRIPEALIDQFMQQDSDYWIESASQLCLKKYRNEPISDYNSWTKRARFLQTRGFTFEHIQAALGEVEYI
jgi:regulatory protein